MTKLVVPFIAAVLTMGSLATFAVGTASADELTPQERAEMRARADRLREERANAPRQEVRETTVTHHTRHTVVRHTRHGKHVVKHVQRHHHHRV